MVVLDCFKLLSKEELLKFHEASVRFESIAQRDTRPNVRDGSYEPHDEDATSDTKSEIETSEIIHISLLKLDCSLQKVYFEVNRVTHNVSVSLLRCKL